ncbi:cupin domain-containing protein [Streptomyces sp. NPDC059740]|uniref:cupin domain-containing protein n=1 Tax=Streptomyces sp. NPDC059740 TaxID=3346926 RepID=UPI0036675527
MVSFAGPPGAVAVSHLAVYDWEAADNVCGGTPHLHLTCTEGYVVTGGRGAVQTLTASGFEQAPLAPGDLVWFTPGTIHRLVNEGDLRIVVMMQNSGLPEAGDAVLTLPPEYLTDRDTYQKAVALPPAAQEAACAQAARARRDLAISGFTALRESFLAGDREPLAAFHRAAVELVRPLAGQWRERWQAGAAAASAATGEQLDRLRAGDASHLAEAAVYARHTEPQRRFGMCGRLDVYDLEGN